MDGGKTINHVCLRYTAMILLAPPLWCISNMLLLSLKGIFLRGVPFETFYSLSLYIFMSGLVIAYPSMVIIGIPIILLLRYLGKNRFWHFGLSGTIAGFLILLFLVLLGMPQTHLPFLIFYSALSGFIFGAFCWFFMAVPLKKAAITPPSSK